MPVLERRPGDHALYINEDEREYLLPRGTAWSVVKAEDVENLSVNADFPLHDRTTGTASFDHVRLDRGSAGTLRLNADIPAAGEPPTLFIYPCESDCTIAWVKKISASWNR